MSVIILIDSATKRSTKRNKYGESVAAWCAWEESSMKIPFRCGIHYFNYEGPNKTFYQGVIRSLEQCLDACWEDKVNVLGDCKLVIEQLKGKYKIRQMQKEYRQVQALINKYREKNNHVSFQYINDADPLYWKIDQLAKRGRQFVRENLQRSKPSKKPRN